MLKLAPEGYPFILACSTLTLITALVFPSWPVLVPFVLTLFMVFFFRDPERAIHLRRAVFHAPADGKVIFVGEIEEKELVKKRMVGISIFMSPLNVHVNRSPCNGMVQDVRYYPGKFLRAYHEDSFLRNEHITMLLRTEHGDVVVRQVAGFLARRAVCRVQPGDSLTQGQRYGIIKFSSRVDVFLPLDVDVQVKLNGTVKAGETVIASTRD